MFQKIVPVALVALAALASVGTAVAHDVIVPRQGFDTALASLQSAPSVQTRSVSDAQAQGRSNAQPVSNASAKITGASSDDSGWFKDR